MQRNHCKKKNQDNRLNRINIYVILLLSKYNFHLFSVKITYQSFYVFKLLMIIYKVWDVKSPLRITFKSKISLCKIG